jgi:hypothetical protein
VYFVRAGERGAHFKHFPGVGTPRCEEFHGGEASEDADTGSASPVAGHEADELPLALDPDSDDWTLALVLPDMPREELRGQLTSTLQHGLIRVFTGDILRSSLSGLDVRPGAAPRAVVPPSSQEYRAEPAGVWAPTVATERWRCRAAGLRPMGTAFRLRGGEWLRYGQGDVHWGEQLLVVANDQCKPPPRECSPVGFRVVDRGNGRWQLWRTELPRTPSASAELWLRDLGLSPAPPRWRLQFGSVPRSFDGPSGARRYFIGEDVRIWASPPTSSATTTLYARVGEESAHAQVHPSESTAAVELRSGRPGPAEVVLAADPRSRLALEFVDRPSASDLRAELARLPRMTIRIDGHTYDGWVGATRIERRPGAGVEVSIDAGIEDARVTFVTNAGGIRRIAVLSPADAAQRLSAALSDPVCEDASVDAGCLGKIRFSFRETARNPDLAQSKEARPRGAVVRGGPERPGAFATRALSQRGAWGHSATAGVPRAAIARLRAVARGRASRSGEPQG